ncbi:carbohydrate ABC transporter permease [Chloroflexi bacterium TSY]|nr:carbohydrate ABC transporter permease [Chloroflexi bacterium TSY]
MSQNVLIQDRAQARARLLPRRLPWRAIMAHLLLAIGAITMIVPFLWMLSTSLKNDQQAYIFPPIWIPSPIMWSNYITTWQALPFDLFFLNSTIVSVFVTFGQLATCSLGAFAFARLHFPARDKLFILYLATMMIPFQVTMIPVFILVRELKWIDSYQGLIIPLIFSAYGTFLLRQFFMSIPQELEDASKIDGCGYFRIYWNIMLPLSKPALATLGIFVFMWSWNNFLWPLLITNTLEMKTLPLGLAFFLGQYTIYWNLLMVGATITLLPVLIVFFFAGWFKIRFTLLIYRQKSI